MFNKVMAILFLVSGSFLAGLIVKEITLGLILTYWTWVDLIASGMVLVIGIILLANKIIYKEED